MATPPPRLQKLPPEWAKLQRAEARKMLAIEKSTLDGMREDVEAEAEAAIAAIARRRQERESNATKAAVLAVLLMSGDRLRDKLRKRVRTGHTESRKAALGRLGAELSLAGHVLGFGAAALQLMTPRTHEDHAHAVSAADTLAAAWKASVVHSVTIATREEKSPEKAVDKATAIFDPRLRRVAATEIPRVYSEEHMQAAADVVEHLDDIGVDTSMLVMRWDAILDARTCDTCAGHDGEVVPLGGSYRGGDIPGGVHNFCRCMDSVVAIPRI